MKFPGGNPLLFCEQVGTVTSFFEQWNDCERTVVLYALLKRVPFANLKFLQLSIDYNLAQNYSSQSKLQLMETHANNANYLNKLVQRYQTCCGGAEELSSSTSAINNNNSSIANNNLTISDSGYESEKKSSTFDLSSTSSLSCTSSTSALSSCTSSSTSQPAVKSSSSSTSSSSSSSSTVNPAKPSAAAVNATDLHIVNQKKKINQPADKVAVSRKLSPSPAPPTSSTSSEVETKKDILNDMLTYLPLLKPGNDDVKSVYMSLIPAAVEDACQQAVPTELVQHILSYLLIHPAVNNDDRRSLSYWLRHLEEHIATSYVPTSGSTVVTNANSNSNNQHLTHSSGSKLMNNNSNNYFVAQPGGPHHPQQQQMLGGGAGPPNNNGSVSSGKGSGSQQSLHYLATGPWPPLTQPPPQQQHQHPLHNLSQPTTAHHQPPLQSTSSSNSSLLSKSQQSLNHASNCASSSSSSSCLDSASSQLMKTAKNSTMVSGVANLDWSTTSAKDAISVCEDGGGGGATGSSINGVHVVGSMENVSMKEYVPVSFNYHPATPSTSQNHSKHHLIAPSSQTQGLLGSTSGHSSGSNLNLNGGGVGHPVVLSTSGADLDSSDDNHLSFSKNGTEIFDYDCDFDNEEEFKYLARAAAAAVAAVAGVNSNASNVSSISGKVAAGSAVNSTANSSHNSSSVSKNRVSFDSNISDYLRVPPIGVGDFDLDNSGLMKTRRSNSLTTTVGNACGLSVGELHQQQKQNNECLSAENLSNLQLLQNKPRSFSLTMESPRSSLTSSGSETRLDDFKQHQMIKMYGQSNSGMSSIAHWLKSLRLHKYVWLFTNLTYEQMLEMNEEYLASLGVTKGARHKLVLCIQKLNERYGVLARLEKELLASGGSKGHLGVVFEELTNIVLTPMKPVGRGDSNDIAGHFMKVLDLIASILLSRSVPGGFGPQQEEEYLNAFTWLLDRALHNDAFSSHCLQIKEYKYKANKLKINYTPKSHYSKNSSMNGSINKTRWPNTNKHKPNSSDGNLQKTPHRKSSLQYFTSPLQVQPQQQQSPQQQQQQLHQQQSSSGISSTAGSGGSHSHLHTIPPPSHAYGYGSGHNPNAGTGHNNSYNKSSSYPNFASGGSTAVASANGNMVKHHPQHPQQIGQQGPPPPPPHLQNQQQHQQQVHLAHQQQQQQQPHQQQQSVHVPPGAFMYHRHSLNNISAQQHQQQFLQHLQSQQQQQQQLPSIFLTPMGGPAIPPPSSGGPSNAGQGKSPQPMDHSTSIAGPPAPVELHSSGPVVANVDGKSVEGLNSSTGSTGNNSSNKSQNSSIGDINSRLEFLCLQMTEQAIN